MCRFTRFSVDIVNGLGTAGWFVLVGGAVLAAGCRLAVGKLWGRGLAVFAQLLLLPVAWYLIVGSHQPAIGIPVGIIALGVLVLLFSPPRSAGPPGVISVVRPAQPTAVLTVDR